MADTINNGIPLVPENTIDPAAGLNLALLVIDRLLQLKVLDMKLNAPPASPSAGSRYIVGTAPTGDWVGKNLQVAEWMPDGYWQFSPASVTVFGTSIWLNTGTDWVPASAGGGAAWGGITGTLADQADLIALLDDKVDKVSGKQLSTEDYSSAEKAKLSDIATEATKNATDAHLLNRANHTGTQPASSISGLGTAAAADVVTDNFTAVSPQLLRVGSAGLLGSTYLSSDLPADVAGKGSHIVRLNTSTSGAPSENLTCLAMRPLANYMAAIAVSHINGRVFSGYVNNSVAPVWSELFTNRNVLGTVSQSDGVPTGSLFQSGSNASGKFERKASGTQECWGTINDGRTASGTIDLTVNLPIAFIATDYVVTLTSDAANPETLRYSVRDYALNNFKIRSNKTDGTPVTWRWEAKGRWFA